MKYDCRSCGACCCNPDENRAIGYADYVQVFGGDRLHRRPVLVRRLTVLNERGERHMKLAGRKQRCAALEGRVGTSVSCGIYPWRPAACRRVEPGGSECRRRRRERGICTA